MSDIKLFKIDNEINEIPASSANLERDLQILIEQNMNTISEFFSYYI